MQRKTIVLFLVIVVVLIGSYRVSKINFLEKQVKKEPVNVVFLGDKEYEETFSQSVKSGKVFSDSFATGLNSKKVGDYETAIKLFNNCLSHAALGPEVAMVYKQLSEIYRVLDNLEMELFYLDQISKYTMSERIKRESAVRATEIRQILSAQKEK